MNKIMLIIFAMFLLFTTGCYTMYQAAIGKNTGVQNIGEAIAMDTKGLWRAMVKFDKWLEKNYW
jgi:hypothetical protein